jgi:purine nucleosidase
VKVLLDTDLGNDIDDAICLSYLVAQPLAELVGVTTVTAEPLARAKLASALCPADVPIAPGAARPLEGEPLQEPPLEAEALLARWPHRESFDEDAVSLMRRVIRAHPGEVTLVAIGALTNVAQLFRADPAVPALLRSLVLMGGQYLARGDKGEWNVRNDPAAASLVFQAGVPHLRAIGLDVTRQVHMDAASFRARFDGKLVEFAGPWLALRDGVTFHDPLAAVTLFEPAVCGYERGTVTLDGPFTVFDPSPGGPHEIATSVSPGAFFDHFLPLAA